MGTFTFRVGGNEMKVLDTIFFFHLYFRSHNLLFLMKLNFHLIVEYCFEFNLNFRWKREPYKYSSRYGSDPGPWQSTGPGPQNSFRVWAKHFNI